MSATNGGYGRGRPPATANISPDGRYRYHLGRSWGEGARVTFVMLNPSTADGIEDDPTIRRCMGFAGAWGFAGIVVVNLYALRATDPKELRRAGDPIGPHNDFHLRMAALRAYRDDAPLVAAWGAGGDPARVAQVLALPGFNHMSALGVTKGGHPRHPLYLRRGLTPERWPS